MLKIIFVSNFIYSCTIPHTTDSHYDFNKPGSFALDINHSFILLYNFNGLTILFLT